MGLVVSRAKKNGAGGMLRAFALGFHLRVLSISNLCLTVSEERRVPGTEREKG